MYTKPKGVTTQMNALDKNILKVVITGGGFLVGEKLGRGGSLLALHLALLPVEFLYPRGSLAFEKVLPKQNALSYVGMDPSNVLGSGK